MASVKRRYRVRSITLATRGINTIVLGGIDVVVPVEIDLEDDASTPDELRLVSDDGYYEGAPAVDRRHR